MKEKFPGVFLIDGKVATRATFKDWKPFSEQIVKGYRLWDPNRSKASAAIAKGIVIRNIHERHFPNLDLVLSTITPIAKSTTPSNNFETSITVPTASALTFI